MYDDEKQNNHRALIRFIQMIVFSAVFYVLICFATNYLIIAMQYTANHDKSTFEILPKFFYTPPIAFKPIMVMTISLLLSLLLVYRLDTTYRIKHDNKYIKGRERFMNDKEMSKLLYSFPDTKMESAEKSGIILAHNNGRFYIDCETIHSMIIGTTRSGKGQTFVMPMVRHIALSQTKHSLVLNDPKGELLENCYDILKSQGYSIKVLNLRDTNKSSLWNPLQTAIDEYKNARDNNLDLDKTIKQVQSLATVFTYDDKSDPIWPESAKSLLTAMILYMFEKGYEDGYLANISMYSIFNFFIEFGTENEVQSSNGAKRDVNALDELFQTLPRGSAAKAAYATSRFSSGDTRSSVLTTLSSNISIFGSDTGISKLTSGNQIKFEELANPDKPMAVFMVVPDEDTSRHVIASLFINQCYNALVEYASNFVGQKLPQRVEFILDEFGNMVPIPAMDTKITVGAGRNLLFNLFVQDLNQLDTKYNNAAKTIRSNCGNMIYINSLDKDTNEYFSSVLGNKTVEYNTYSGDLHSFLSHQSGTVDSEPLIKPAELGRLQFGTAITKRQRCYPIKTVFEPFYMLGIKTKSIDLISENMELIHKSLEETIYPLDTIWERLFIPVSDRNGNIFTSERIYDENNNPVTTYFTKNIKENKSDWIELTSEQKNMLMRQLDNFISSDGNTKTAWDRKRIELGNKVKAKPVATTDFVDKTPHEPTEKEIAIETISRMNGNNDFNRFIEDKNFTASQKLINQAFAKKIISAEQKKILEKYLQSFFNVA